MPPTPPTLSFWFDFASTYSYPAAMRVDRLAAERGVRVDWRPFLLGPIFAGFGWTDSPFNLQPVKGRYMWRDLERICRRDGLPFLRPDPFPQHSVLAARVALVAMAEGWGPDFCRAVFAAEFGQGRAIADRSVLSALVDGLGHDAAGTLARAEAPANKEHLKDQTAEAARLGLFGAPSFVAPSLGAPDGELFWGNDRLEDALDWCLG